jgi:hypothetical protein|uniref:Gasdermin bGSDM n=1 Tax=Unknown prokaryotic organism TaxID=2725 RepID=GSDM_UNKP|nr:RecName: Full=Gasdermin bGSDM; Short=bGSDM; AltName: Full=Bacterial gasdermin; Contains: RecName: Full=Gasdermin bGSDM, N-terminus [unidentified prokaryotic organism]
MIKYLQSHLEEQGYLFVTLPKPDLAPLQLLTEYKGHLEEYDGSLLDLFEPDGSPFPIRDRQLPNFSGQQLLQTDWSAGADLLHGLFKLFQQKEDKLKASLSGMKGLVLSFAYENIEEERVSEQALDNFLAGAMPKKEGFQRSVERLQDGELYVLTSVMRSNQFTVTIDCQREDQGKLEAAVAEIVDAHASIERKQSNSFSLQTEGEQAFVFACRAAQVLYNKKQWFQFWKKDKDGFRIEKREGMVVRGEEDFSVQPLQAPSGLLKL